MGLFCRRRVILYVEVYEVLIVETESIRSLRVQNKAMVFFYMHLKLQSALLFYSGKMIF